LRGVHEQACEDLVRYYVPTGRILFKKLYQQCQSTQVLNSLRESYVMFYCIFFVHCVLYAVADFLSGTSRAV